jgi:serine/threonine protein phosphatase PrpC
MVLPVPAGWIVCVADGTGGSSGGAEAADLFISGIQRASGSITFHMGEPAAWVALFEALDAEIARAPLAGETTGVALAVVSGSVVGASCGNSRAYLSTQAGLRELTSGQSHRPRLGTGRASVQPFSAEAHGVLVAATDGLFDHVNPADVTNAVRAESADPGDALIRLVLDRHKALPDDVAIVVGWLD